MKQIPNYDYSKYTSASGQMIYKWQHGEEPLHRWDLRKLIRKGVLLAYNDGYERGSRDAGAQAIADIKRKIKKVLII